MGNAASVQNNKLPVGISTRPLGAPFNECLTPKVVVEIFADLACPFACKTIRTVCAEVLPTMETSKPGDVQFVYHNVIQPWHPQSALAHMTFFAIKQLNGPQKATEFANLFVDHRENFTSDKILNKSNRQVLQELSELGALVGVDSAAILSKLTGGDTTGDVKLSAKFHRKRGIHVTPTVLLNGLEASFIESSYTAEQWIETLNSIVDA